MSSREEVREPFSLDTVVKGLGKVPFSPPFLVLLPLFAFLLDRRGESASELLGNFPTLSA